MARSRASIHNFLITIPLAIRRRGGKGIRTPDIQLAKLALYQLSYAPDEEFGMSIADGEFQGLKAVARKDLNLEARKDS